MYTTNKQRLMNRLYQNNFDFQTYIGSLSRSALIESAGRIASVTEVFDYMTKEREWEDEEIDFLLLFSDPLTLVADEWESFKADKMSDVEDGMWELFGNDDLTTDYPLSNNARDWLCSYSG